MRQLLQCRADLSVVLVVVAGKGIVVLSACSHAGIVNVMRDVQVGVMGCGHSSTAVQQYVAMVLTRITIPTNVLLFSCTA